MLLDDVDQVFVKDHVVVGAFTFTTAYLVEILDAWNAVLFESTRGLF